MSDPIPASLQGLSPDLLKILGNTSVIPAPDGVVPNFVDPETRGPTQVITSAVLMGIAIVFFANRVYLKFFVMKKLSWDDGILPSISYMDGWLANEEEATLTIGFVCRSLLGIMLKLIGYRSERLFTSERILGVGLEVVGKKPG
jgi:hypothetical protein